MECLGKLEVVQYSQNVKCYVERGAEGTRQVEVAIGQDPDHGKLCQAKHSRFLSEGNQSHCRILAVEGGIIFSHR